jgi:hypothetical protein
MENVIVHMGSLSQPSWSGPRHQCVHLARTARSSVCWHTVTTRGHGQCARRGAELNGKPVAQIPHRRQENDPWNSADALLHRNLEGDGGNRVVSGVELGSVVALGVEKGNDVEGVGDSVLLLHKQEEDMRKRFGH